MKHFFVGMVFITEMWTTKAKLSSKSDNLESVTCRRKNLFVFKPENLLRQFSMERTFLGFEIYASLFLNIHFSSPFNVNCKCPQLRFHFPLNKWIFQKGIPHTTLSRSTAFKWLFNRPFSKWTRWVSKNSLIIRFSS